MKPDILQRSFDFGLGIIQTVRQMPKKPAGRILGNQLLRAGTSIAANIEEAQSGGSRADFLNKMAIALKEVRETNLWLRFVKESEELKKILGSICSKIYLQKESLRAA